MIISCEHKPESMGLCSACSAEVSASVERSSKESRKREKADDLIRTLEARGEYGMAETIRAKEAKRRAKGGP